jgi:hypothetical protein
MKYVVSDDFVGGEGWTADILAQVLEGPLAQIGVTVERVHGHDPGGFRADGLPPQAYKAKFDAVARAVAGVLRRPPP